MRLFILGHAYTSEPIHRFILKNHPDIVCEIDSFQVSRLDKMQALLQQADKEFDGVLFSGRTSYDIMLSRMTPHIPWVVVLRRERQLLSALLEASATRRYDIQKVSVDAFSLAPFEPDIMERVYKRIGMKIHNVHIYYVDHRPADKDPFVTLLEEHSRLYEAGTVNFCLTSVSPVYEELQRRGIPALRIRFDEIDIETAITEFRLKHLQLTLDQTEIGIAMIELYEPGEEFGGTYRQRAALRGKLELTDELLALSNRLQGAFIELGGDKFCLLIQHPAHPKRDKDELLYDRLPQLLRYASQRNVGINIGLSYHSNLNICRQHALKALGAARYAEGSAAFFCDYDGNCHGPLRSATVSWESQRTNSYQDGLASQIAQRTGLPTNTIERLLQIKYIKKNGEFTSHDCAKLLGISHRNANRILLVLEDKRVIEIVGKRTYPGGGRPLRVFRIKD